MVTAAIVMWVAINVNTTIFHQDQSKYPLASQWRNKSKPEAVFKKDSLKRSKPLF
jgi:hypothetical protein